MQHFRLVEACQEMINLRQQQEQQSLEDQREEMEKASHGNVEIGREEAQGKGLQGHQAISNSNDGSPGSSSSGGSSGSSLPEIRGRVNASSRPQRYEWVVRGRLDGLWKAPPPPLSSLDPNAFTIPYGCNWWGVNDRFGVGGPRAAEAAMRRVTGMDKIARTKER